MSENNTNKKQSTENKSHGPFGGGHKGTSAMISGEKAKNFGATLKKLAGYLSKYKIRVSLVFIFAIASTIFSIVGPKILGQATTKIYEGVMGKIAGTASGIDFAYIGNIILILAVLYLASSVFQYLQGFIMTGVTMEVTYTLRKEMSEKINKLPLRYFDKQTHGEVLSRITNDVDTISQSLNQSLTQLITSATTIVGVLIMMFSINWVMALIAILVIPVSALIISFIVKISQKYFSAQQEYLGHVNGHVEEMYSGHIVIKAFNKEQDSIDEFNEYNNTLYHSAWLSQFLSSMMQPAMTLVGNVGYVAVCILGAYMASIGSITVGDIQAFIQYMRQFTQPITQLASSSSVLQQTAAAAERVFEFLSEEEEKEVRENLKGFDLEQIKGNVNFKNVTFGYDENEMIIKNFSADIKAGQKVAIVGPTGAGKTTLVKLLMRFYDLNSGQILMDGTDITNYKRHDERKALGMVLQDTWLYNDTIMNNIRYGNLDATDEDVEAAAKAAHVDHFIKTCVGGYQMVLNEDATNVSSGQKQLLTIARALLADPKILILDEATSSVDTRTERLIVKAMSKLMENRTSFVIAHRLSTIKDSDLILVVNEGNIVEQGNHEELLAKNGFYANLYNSQFEEAS